MSGPQQPAGDTGGPVHGPETASVLGRAAHDLNNLCASMMGFTALAQESLEPAAAVQSYLSEIQKAAEQAAALARRLRQLSERLGVARD